MFHARKKTAGRTVLRCQRGADGDARPAFRRAVAFQNAHAVFLGPERRGGFLQFLRAGKQVAQAAEILRVRLAAVTVEKRVRAEQNRAVAFVEHRGDHAVMQWRRVDEHVKAADQWHERADREAKAVEQRQRIEHAVAVVHVAHRKHLPHVGEEVGVRQFHPLGHALGAAGKKHHRGIIRGGSPLADRG